MSGALQAVFQNQRSFVAAPGQQAYTTAGSYSFVVPTGVTKVSMVAIGGGRGGETYLCTCPGTVCCPNPNYLARYWLGGCSGALAYSNNKTVTPGETLAVVIPAANCAYASSVKRASTYIVGAGYYSGGQVGCVIRQTGGASTCFSSKVGGAGAAGYSTNGTDATTSGFGNSSSGGGGGSGGGGSYGSGGGGTGILGLGSNGAGGSGGTGGGGGSGGAAGGASGNPIGGAYGGAGGSGSGSSNASYAGAGGAVRIVWPGCARSYPSTRMPDE